ncbi:Uncharacterised protein [Streptococcus pneumoniae]|nr:Uncharacterised protein [Streptococcus pneumoniae]
MVLPVPLTPIKPILSKSWIIKEISLKTVLSPTDLLSFSTIKSLIFSPSGKHGWLHDYSPILHRQWQTQSLLKSLPSLGLADSHIP